MSPVRLRLTALVLLLAIAPPLAADQGSARDPSPWLQVRTYEPDGPFVTIPAKTFGYTTLILVGGSAAILCMPIDLVRGVYLRRGYGDVAEACADQVAQPAASITYIAGGGPFWLLKRGLWDAPRRLFGRERQPQPPPAAEPPG